MIKNDRQYRITKAQAEKFAAAMAELEQSAEADEVHPILRKAQEDALRSQYEDLRAQLDEYEALNPVERNRRKRDQLLKALYEHSEGNFNRYQDLNKIEGSLGYSREDIRQAARYLVSNGLIKSDAGWKFAKFTNAGVRKAEAIIQSENTANARPIDPIMPSSRKVFIVHGHDEQARETVARFVEKLGLEVVILHEQPNLGSSTVIEKLERHTDVAYAVVLLTPDDVGAPEDELSRIEQGELTGLNQRARQNVIFELGYFLAKLTRERVCALYKPGVEIPSDYQGVLYTEMDPQGAWRKKLAQELAAAELDIDLNNAI